MAETCTNRPCLFKDQGHYFKLETQISAYQLIRPKKMLCDNTEAAQYMWPKELHVLCPGSVAQEYM